MSYCNLLDIILHGFSGLSRICHISTVFNILCFENRRAASLENQKLDI